MKLANLLRGNDRGATMLRFSLSGLLVLAAAGVGSGIATPAAAAPADGTVKIDGQDVANPNDPANDPKLECAIPMEFQGFDNGVQFQATITFEGQGGQPDPVVSGGDLSPTFTGKGAGVALFQTYYVAGADHIKITVRINNGYNKFKVFKVKPCPAPTFTVVKANDADKDGTYGTPEQAAASGAAVPFRARITNTSPYSITVSAITDSIDGAAGVPVTCAPALTTIPAAGVADCLFTLTSYAPAAGGSKVNTVEVTANQVGAPAVASTVTSNQSTVTTPAAAKPAPTLELLKSNDADGDGTFEVSDVADAVGEAVPFQVTIKNTSAYGVTLDSVTDQVVGGGTTSWTCAAINGTIASGATATCSFTMPAYSPAADGTQKKNTVDVTVHETGAAANDATVTSAQSIVTTVLPVIVTPTCQTDPSLCPPTPTCQTDPSLCPPIPTCQTDATLCPPPPATCATDPSLCPPPATCATDPSLCPPPATCATDPSLCPPPVDTPPANGGGEPISGTPSPEPATGESPAPATPAASPSASALPAVVTEEEPPSVPRSLPFTGSATDLLLGLGAGLSVIGLLLALTGRRRRTIA